MALLVRCACRRDIRVSTLCVTHHDILDYKSVSFVVRKDHTIETRTPIIELRLCLNVLQSDSVSNVTPAKTFDRPPTNASTDTIGRKLLTTNIGSAMITTTKRGQQRNGKLT